MKNIIESDSQLSNVIEYSENTPESKAKISFSPQEINDQIVSWLKDYALNANTKGFVVGISGGIDSAVASTLAAQTGLKLLCLEMPIHQSKTTINRAQEQINFLKQNFDNVEQATCDLTSTFEEFKSQVPSDNEAVNLALANTRARLRMTTLYYFATLKTLLVLGTGNKIEDFGVGFFTKYGDGGVDLSPIADLMKSEVYQLAKYQNLPESIQNAIPTDGLFEDERSDEDQLGASYDELEKAMLAFEQGKKSEDFQGREKEVFDIFIRLNRTNQHKFKPIPVCKIQK